MLPPNPKKKQKKTCSHSIFKRSCRSCRALQRGWYRKLERSEFDDIEYGLEDGHFIKHVPDPTTPGAREAQAYYERAWEIFHTWMRLGRTRRDCRVAELFAAQNGRTGTIRGISQILKDERLSPWSTKRVQITVKEIHAAIAAGLERPEKTETDPIPYVRRYYASA